jgi:tripartite-type tricarboxylate transporter receptor subunit TctC
MKPIILVVGLCFVVASAGWAVSAFAQEYPTKPVRVIVPYTAGSPTDVFGRIVCEKLSELWGQPVVVENRPGAGGTVGASAVVKSAPDGYTLLVHSSSYSVNPALYANLPYDPQKDFVDIAPLARQPNVLVVGLSAGVKSVSELVAAAKAKPGQLKFGSAGIGSAVHLVAEKFRIATGIDVVHVPYAGTLEANVDTMAGRITYCFPPVATALKEVREGKLLALGVTSARRSGWLPEVPTMAEAGVPLEYAVWWGIWVRAGTPDSVVDKLGKDVARALAAPDLREKFTKLGAEPMSMTPAEFARFVRSEIESAAGVVKAAGIKPQ